MYDLFLSPKQETYDLSQIFKIPQRSLSIRKNGSRPTRLEKKIMDLNGYEPSNYLVISHTTHELWIISKNEGVKYALMEGVK